MKGLPARVHGPCELSMLSGLCYQSCEHCHVCYPCHAEYQFYHFMSAKTPSLSTNTETLSVVSKDMGGCQNCGPFLDPYYNIIRHLIFRIPKKEL